MMKNILFCAFVVVCRVLAAFEPYAELYSSATNLIVTESADVFMDIYLPAPDEKTFGENTPPYYFKRPMHLTVPFLDNAGTDSNVVTGDVNDMKPSELKRGDVFFTLNNYVTDSIDSFFNSDPFSMMNRDPFEMMGPKRVPFPYEKTETIEIDGVKVWKFTVKFPKITAKSEGEANLIGVSAQVRLLDRIKKDHFGRQSLVLKDELVLRTDPVKLRVKNPPEEGRPENFCGAIATNASVTASLDANVYTAGDPAIFTMEIKDVANPSDVTSPLLEVLDTNSYFRVDRSSVKTDTSPSSRIFKWRVRVTKAGTVEFPSVKVAVFDLSSRRYKILKTQPIPVQVKAGAQIVLGTLEDDGDAPFPFPDGLDLSDGGFESLPLLPRLNLSLLLFIFPPLLFACIKLLPRLSARIGKSSKMKREKNAFAICKKKLIKAKSVTVKEAAIGKFFRDRYNVDPSVVTSFDVRGFMKDGFSAEDIRLVEKALEDIERARYSTKSGSARLFMLFFVSVVSVVVLGAFQVPSEKGNARAAFSWQRANSLAINAVTEEDYAAAAEAYRQCINEGARNPAIFSNYASCLLFSKKAREAYESFARIERYAGETPSTLRGLLAARAVLTADPRAQLPLIRIFMRPHFKYPLDTRLLWLASAWAALWLIMFLPKGFVRKTLVTVVVLFIAACAVSVSISLFEESLVGRSVQDGQ